MDINIPEYSYQSFIQILIPQRKNFPSLLTVAKSTSSKEAQKKLNQLTATHCSILQLSVSQSFTVTQKFNSSLLNRQL